MAFANLFTRLAAVEDVKSPVQPVLTDRNETGDGGRHRNGKRKNKGKQTGPNEKRPRHQTQTTRTTGAASFKNDNHQAKHSQCTFREYAEAGFNNKILLSHVHRNNRYEVPHKGQNTKSINERHVNQQQGQKKKKWEQQKHRQQDGRGPGNRWGRPQRTGGEERRNRNEDSEVKRTRFMTQEFKDQNAISVGDRLLCKHFLWGKCIKGDECQLEHVEGYNGLVKSSCKFYIQGTCTKGESCPYMHNSFPCKFFHRRGKCNQGDDCRFSHEPLDELSNKLLEEALQRENDLIELSKKADDESEQPVNSGPSENTEATKTPDVLFQPLRPNFYQSVEIKAEEESLVPQEEELTENSEEAVTPQAAQPHSAPSANLDQKEPVCYSVEAMLGPQLSKPLLSFFTAPRSEEPALLCSSDSPPASASNNSPAPYSVEAVLKSFKSVETPPPPSYSKITVLKKNTDPNSETQSETSCYSVEGNKFQGKLFQSLPSFQTYSNLMPNSCSGLTLPSGELRRQVGNKQESLKPEVKSERLDVQKSSDISESKTNQHKTVSLSSSSRTSSSFEHPVLSKPHLAVKTPDSRASFKLFTPSSESSKFRGKETVPTVPISNLVKSNKSADFVCKPTTEQPAKDTTADHSSKKADGRLGGGCKLKTSFQSLFAKPITDSLQLEDASTTSFCPQGLNQSSDPALKSAGLKANCVKTGVQRDKPPARSFVGLFAAPLCAAPLPSLQPQGDHSKTSSAFEAESRFSDSEQRAEDLRTQRHEKTDVQTPLGVKGVCPVPTSSHFSPDPEKEHKGGSAECKDQKTDQACGPVSGSSCEGSTPFVPEISSCKEVAPKSILRTLFQRLGPYQQDGEQQDPDQRIQMEADVSTGRVCENQQQTRKKRRRRKK